jgi:hypothetical protein
MKQLLLVWLACIVLPVAAYSTPYISPEEALKVPAYEDEPIMRSVAPPTFFYTYDPLTRFEMCADFIVTMQVSDTSVIAYGGMREGEHMLNVIQTDNTSEAIWIWSHYYALTGSDNYHDNIDAAWEYCMNFRAYDEEGGDDRVTGYYRVYNCAWALRAEMEYRQVYGDNTYEAYADSCASYLCHHPLYLFQPVGMHKRLNGMVQGWAVGNLYEYGAYSGNPVFMARAVDLADSVRHWAEVNPNKFHWKEWAMEGGAVMWGVVHSWFAEYPDTVVQWVERYAPYLDTEVDSSQYQNAWRAWAALGQVTASEVLGSGVYGAYFKHLADTLVLNDGDNDGGIPVIDAEPDDRDQSWVTNYLGFMCMDKLLENSGVRQPDVARAALKVSAAPVPCSGLPNLLFRLDSPTSVRVEIYDVAGRRVGGKDAGVLGLGLHSLKLSDASVHGDIPPGIYFYTLHSGTGVANGKMVVLR